MDIDIDLRPDVKPEKLLDNLIFASMIQDGDFKKHPVGAYLQNIPIDSITKLSAIPYKVAEDEGFNKIDFLHLNLLDIFDSKEEIRTLIKKEPDWSLLEDREIVKKLFHIGNHFDTVYDVKPTSVMELADVLALIRPGKLKLLDKYKKDKKAVRQELYTKRKVSDLRKSHAVPYALLIVLQLHLIKAKIL